MKEFLLKNNDIDNWVLVEFYKNVFAELPKEESQMFIGKSFANNENTPNYSTLGQNNIDNVISKVQNNNLDRLNSNVTETDYSGIINSLNKIIIGSNECNVTFFKEGEWVIKNLFQNDFDNKFRIVGRNQFLKIPPNTFIKEEVVDDENIVVGNDYGIFYINIEPLFIETTIISINQKEHYPFNSELETLLSQQGNRRTIYEINITPFLNNNYFRFEDSFSLNNKSITANRLLGSVVYKTDNFGVDENIKIITNDSFDFVNNKAYICLSPDYMGYDSPINNFSIGDKIKIYPKETTFMPLIIKVNYSEENIKADLVQKYLLNDAIRDLKTNIMEVYDDNGVQLDTDGNPNGNTIMTFQVTSDNKKEVKRRLD